MRLGSHNGIGGVYGEERYKRLKPFGFDYADLSIEGDLNGKTEAEYEAEILRQKTLADEAGVTIWQVHGPWIYPPHDETEERRAERKKVMERSLRLTEKIGCKYWVIHPVMPFGPDAEPDYEEFWRINLEFFRSLLLIAKGYGITICFENMPMHHLKISPPDETLRFIREINDENFKFCLDTGHCSALGLSPADAVRMAGKDLKVLHVHDNGGELDEHLVPQMGVIDWQDFKKALIETGFEGVYSLECGWRKFLPNASNETRLKALCAVLEEIVP